MILKKIKYIYNNKWEENLNQYVKDPDMFYNFNLFKIKIIISKILNKLHMANHGST
jgi:hypothetical protein